MLSTLKVIAVLLVVGYLGILLLMYVMQSRLLYPSSGVVQPLQPSNELARAGLTAWPEADPVALVASPDSARGTVVVFHGNGGTALQRGYYVEALRQRGLRVVLAEYPNYGWRDGAISEAELVADARRTLELAHDAFGGPLIVWGESLGAGVAAAAIHQLDVPVEAVILLTPWDTLPNVASSAYPWLPVRWLLRDRYDSIENLRGFDGRVAVLVAEDDRVIPPARGLALYEGLNAEKRLWTFPGAGHNSWPSHPTASFWDEVIAFAVEESQTEDSPR
ncbi:MAG: alpha/beta hydrolase [Rubricoccaceae bacterium]